MSSNKFLFENERGEWELRFNGRRISVRSKEIALMHANLNNFLGRELFQLRYELEECSLPESVANEHLR